MLESCLPHGVCELHREGDAGKDYGLHGRKPREDRCDGAHGKRVANGNPGIGVAHSANAAAILGSAQSGGKGGQDEEPGHDYGAAAVQDVEEGEEQIAEYGSRTVCRKRRQVVPSLPKEGREDLDTQVRRIEVSGKGKRVCHALLRFVPMHCAVANCMCPQGFSCH